MGRKLIRPILYVAVTLLLFGLMDKYHTRYLFAIARPVLHDYTYTYYSYFSLIWAVTTILYLLPGRGLYFFLPANVILLANSYFVILMRLHFLVFRMEDVGIFVALVLVVGINLLMWLGRMPVKDIGMLNSVTLLSSLPLALQYAVIAPYHGTVR
jgi:hypothetical protein